MKRNRVIVAIVIVVLVAIGLFFLLNGRDGAEAPVAGGSQSGADSTAGSATTPSASAPAATAQRTPSQGTPSQGTTSQSTTPESTTSATASPQGATAGSGAARTEGAPSDGSASEGAASGSAASDTAGAGTAADRTPSEAGGEAPAGRDQAAAPATSSGEGSDTQGTAPDSRDAAAAGGEGAGGEGAGDGAPGTAREVTAAREAGQPDDARTATEDRNAAAGAPQAGAGDSHAALHGSQAAAGAAPTVRELDGSDAAGGRDAPSFDIVRIGRDCRAVIAGRAMPHSLVTVTLGDRAIGQVRADGRGEWVLVPDQPLQPGSGEIRLSAALDGAAAVDGRQAVVVIVPDCAGGPAAQEIIAVQTDDAGERPSRILQMPGLTGEDGGLRLDTVDYDETGKLILSGRADPSVQVNIYANNAPVGQVQSDSEGRWSLLVDDKVPVGEQVLRLDQVGDGGRVQSRVEFPFSRARLSDIDPSQRNVIVQPGNSLWRIARRVYGEGVRYTVIYRANAQQIRDPDLIYPGQIFTLPAAGGSDRG